MILHVQIRSQVKIVCATVNLVIGFCISILRMASFFGGAIRVPSLDIQG